MKDTNEYVPSGVLQGDTKAMPDKGTGTGLNGDTYGADISQDSCNCMGGISGATKSDAEGQRVPSSKGTK